MRLLEYMVTDLRSAMAIAKILGPNLTISKPAWQRIKYEIKSDGELYADEHSWIGFYLITVSDGKFKIYLRYEGWNRAV